VPTALEGLAIGEVSGVDHPAHLEEGWMVLKAAGASPEAIEAVETVEALVDAVAKASYLDPELLAQVGAEVLDDEHRQTLAALGTTRKAKEAIDMPFDKSTLDAEALAYVEGLETQVAKAAAPVVEDEATELAKALDGLPEPIRKAWEAQAEALEKATKTAETERNTRLNAEYLQKAKSLPALGAKPEELGATLRKLADLDADLFVEVETLLKSANELAKAGEDALFKSVGHGARIETGSAHEQLDAFAKSAIEADPSLDYPSALSKVAGEHPDLYAQHRAEQANTVQED
jgi:hypothetical protein